MSDFTRITSRLFTGAALSTAEDVVALKAAGVTAVVDCRAGYDDASLLAGSGLYYLWNPTADDGQPKPPAYFARTLRFVLPLVARRHQQVLLHCFAGSNRGPSSTYVCMRALGWTAADAEALIRAARPGVGLAYKADADAAVLALGYGAP